MKTKLHFYLLVLTMLSLSSFAQIKYEKGYFIDNNNSKTECLIKNMDWEISPKDIQYKLNEDSEVSTLNIDNLYEFGVGNTIRYIRYDIDIDQSSENLNSLTKTRNPIFKNERVFLKLLVEGNANLYLYSGVNIKKYFFNVKDKEVKQLVHKTFYLQVDYNSHLQENNFFRTQLYKEVNCNDAQPKSFDKIDYTKNSLVKYFQKYNVCKGDKIIDNYSQSTLAKKGLFNLKLSAGINQSSFEINNIDYEENTLDFGSKTNGNFGIEFEYILPFNKNKWSVFIEPSYTGYTSSASYNYTKLSVLYTETIDAKIKFIEFPMGARHYFFLTDNSKLFLGIAYLKGFVNVTDIESKNSNNINFTEYKKSMQGLAIGFGYNYKKISAEFRYYTQQDLDNYIFRESNYKKIAIIFRYKIL